MSEWIIRDMRKEDLAQVCAIERENFSLPWSEQSFEDSMNRNDTVFLVALQEENVVGYVGCYCIAGEGEITNVAVKESHRRRGIGVALLEALYEKGECLDTTQFFLEVRKSNEGAMLLYTQQGFVQEGIRKNFYEQPVEDAVIMWKRMENNKR